MTPTRPVNKNHHFHGSPFDTIFKSQNAPNSIPQLVGRSSLSLLREPPAHSWPFEPRTQHTHILDPGAASVRSHSFPGRHARGNDRSAMRAVD